MSDKEQLKEQLEEAQREADKIATEIATTEAVAMHRICRYRNCRKPFVTDDDRRHYCCPEHYLAENRERTKERNKLRKALDTQ